MPPKGGKAVDMEKNDLDKLAAENRKSEKSEFEELGLDTSGLDWATLLEAGTCAACNQRFGDQDKDGRPQ